MAGNVAPVKDEREGLLGFLAQQRYVLGLAAFGLTEDELRLSPSISSLSLAGLIKHCAAVEEYWMGLVTGNHVPVASEADYQSNFELGPEELLRGLIERYEAVAASTEEIVASIPDLGREVPVPKDAPWLPEDIEAWSVRWVLLHLITETARHAGHADIVRESIDGASAFPLMAAAEGWPENPWLTAWRRADA